MNQQSRKKDAPGESTPGVSHLVRSRLAAALIGVTCCTLASAVRAQSADERIARAQALFDEAVRDMDRGRVQVACPKLEAVTRLAPEKIGARETLAECYTKVDKLASAWSSYRVAETRAREQKQPERATELAARAAALEPRLATLQLDMTDAVRGTVGLTITLAGIEIVRSNWSTSLPVDRGEAVVVASAPGYEPYSVTVPIAADGATVRVAIRPLEPTRSANIHADPPPTPVAEERSWQKPLGIAVAGAGVVALGASAILGAMAIGKKDESDADGHCNQATDQCDAVGYPLRNDAHELGNASTATLIVGGVLAVGGLTVILTAPDGPSGVEGARASGERSATLVLSATGVVVRGSW